MGAKHLLRPRVSETTCVICRDDHPTEGCPACGALYHVECLGAVHGRCATLGCPSAPVRLNGTIVIRPSTAPAAKDDGCLLAAVLTTPFLAPLVVLAVVFSDRPWKVGLYLGWPLILPWVLWFGLGATPSPSPPSPSPPSPNPPSPNPPSPNPPSPSPHAAESAPGWTCLLCARPAEAGTSTCADHTALLGDRLGPSRPAGARPGQLYGPGLIDGGGRPWRT